MGDAMYVQAAKEMMTRRRVIGDGVRLASSCLDHIFYHSSVLVLCRRLALPSFSTSVARFACILYLRSLFSTLLRCLKTGKA